MDSKNNDAEEMDEYVSDEELAEEMDIHDPPASPTNSCIICPFKSYITKKKPDEESTITLKRKKSIKNCNYWAKKRKMDLSLQQELFNKFLFLQKIRRGMHTSLSVLRRL